MDGCEDSARPGDADGLETAQAGFGAGPIRRPGRRLLGSEPIERAKQAAGRHFDELGRVPVMNSEIFLLSFEISEANLNCVYEF